MEKVLKKICGVLLLLFLVAGLAACNGEQGTAGDTNNLNGTTEPNSIPTQEPTQQLPAGQHTLEELSATIESVGEFWNRWYASHHTFEWEHIDDSRSNWQPWDETITPAHHPLSRGFAIILPSSGFTRFYEIGDYLLQFYTQAWVDRGFFSEPPVTMQTPDGNEFTLFGFEGFEVYDDELFVFIQTEWSIRPDWATATHTLIEQDGNRAVVETIVSAYTHGFSDEMPTITYRFTFIDGRIDTAYGRWHEANSSQAYHAPQGFYALVGDDMLMLFVYRTEDVVLESFDALHAIEHPSLPGHATERGETILFGATREIHNISLLLVESIWDDVANQDGFTVTDSLWITEALQPGEGITISDYISVDALPWSAITFTTAPGERHFFVIRHDNSDSPYGLVLLDITEQMLAG